MKELVPLHVLERLEREWRLVDPDRPRCSPTMASRHELVPLRRLRVGRVDGTVCSGDESE